ncbi:hypothetical protein GobsT_03920 [Gemmata obscuriglobus]|uniref:Uncharacterized protein n=1 Tax=Gemmata obscuriglobus TaxID=114 RepID=A0A2Z3HDH6_9BACT|nr:hypothetical protein [Gemmata obscuriglobus]AWM41015.1 hypothetical protein C1280_31210 [Gemmata obscuriglobus]QEG25665.1 hypothetical protein GobsT_03920 [Gemmata obscuriglobus]
MKLSAPPPPPPPPSDGNPGAGAPGTPDEQPSPPSGASPAAETPTLPAASAVAPAALKPLTWPAWYSGLDAALAGLVVAFAFAAASFVARNSDAWLHLAAGKRMFAGEYVPGGSDPLSYTAQGRTWVNHSWLTDAAAYLLYGGAGQLLVAVKALLVAAAFGLLIAIRRPAFSLWPWAALACVGVLACAPQFALRPLVVSMFLFAVTLFVLFRMPRGAAHPKRLLVAIGVTFWVWAGADQWFFIGPLALALVLAGELIQKYVFNSPGEPGDTPDTEPLVRLPDVATLAKALGVGVLACTLTPHHVRVWELPFELVGAPGAEIDLRLRSMLLAPTDGDYIKNASLGYNLNGLAYVVLFTGGATIFGLGPARIRIGHVALWLGLAVLSLFSIYAIPFFALVAVPLVAAQLNAFSLGARLRTWGDPRTRLLVIGASGGRVLSVIAVCALGVMAYPGWVHPDVVDPAYAKRLAWGVEPDPALAQAAEQFQAWRADGGLPDDARGLVTSTELANYIAWYAPKEKVFINGRFRHHRPEITDYLAVRKGLGLVRIPDEEPDTRAVAAVLKSHGAEYLALHGGAAETPQMRARAVLAAQRLYLQWGQWSEWYVSGGTVVFGWRGDGAKPSFAALALDPVARAFGPGAAKVPAPELTQPLRQDADPLVEAFAQAPRPAPAGAAEARAWIEYKEALVTRVRIRQQLSVELFFYGPAVQHALHYPVLIGADARGMTRFPARGATPETQAELRAEADALRAIPLLALRAARRAIAEDPDHPDAYFALGLALADPDLPLPEGERALGQITAFRQCRVRLPRPERYKRGQFSVSGTEAALRLAQTYLGQPLVWRDARNREVVDYTGFPVDAAPLRGMLAQPLFRERNGAVSRGEPADQRTAAVMFNGAAFVLPLDLARQELELALQYAPLDIGGDSDERLQASVKQVEAFRREVEDVMIRYKGRYDASRAAAPKIPMLVGRAIQLCMPGEALRILNDKETDFEKEFGRDQLGAAQLLVALDLAVGRIEDAAETLKNLSGTTFGGPTLQWLKYQKAVLAGEYKQAGDLWESLNPEVGALDTLPPPGAGVPKERVLETVQALTRSKNPEEVLNRMLVAPVGLVPEPLQIVPQWFWLQSWESLRQLLQQRLAGQLQADSNFFTRRGVLYLLEGDTPAAKERFKNALRKAPAGWGVPDMNSAQADGYLKLIEKAAGRLPR